MYSGPFILPPIKMLLTPCLFCACVYDWWLDSWSVYLVAAPLQTWHPSDGNPSLREGGTQNHHLQVTAHLLYDENIFYRAFQQNFGDALSPFYHIWSMVRYVKNEIWKFSDIVLKIAKKKTVLVSPTVNSGDKERVRLQNFVLTRHPNFLCWLRWSRDVYYSCVYVFWNVCCDGPLEIFHAYELTKMSCMVHHNMPKMNVNRNFNSFEKNQPDSLTSLRLFIVLVCFKGALTSF